MGWAVVGSCPVYHAASKEHVCIDHTGVIPAAAGDDLASGRITDENKQTGPLAVVVTRSSTHQWETYCIDDRTPLPEP